MLVAAAALGVADHAHAFEINHDNTVLGVVANSLIANANGNDWLSAVLLMELTEGSIYNDPLLDDIRPQQHLWTNFPDLEFDSWVGIPGDASLAVFGSAVDLGDSGPAVVADQKASVTWYNTRNTDTGVMRLANIALTEDAIGTFTVLVNFTGIDGPVTLREDGWVVNGIAYFDLPGDLDGNGFVGVDDLNLVLQYWNQTVPPASHAADPSGDGFVGIDDLNAVLLNWNIGTPPTAGSTVPEPATASLALLAGLTCLGRRSRG